MSGKLEVFVPVLTSQAVAALWTSHLILVNLIFLSEKGT